jgi:hypothetical protein
MATKKPTAKSTALVPWEQEMAARASKSAKQEKPMSSFKKISTRGGQLTIDDEAVEGNELRIVVLAALHENQYYDAPFDPRSPTVPKCFSFSDPEAENPEEAMAPHPEAEHPEGTEEPGEGSHEGNCGDCWANRMGSADVGRGKACKNIRRLAVVTEDALDSAADLADAEMRTLNVPVMSGKNWGKFVRSIADDMSRDYAGVVCTLKVKPDPKSQFVLTFEFAELINFDQELWTAMEKRRKEAFEVLNNPYPKQSDLDQAEAKPVRPTGRMAQAMAKKAPAGKAGAKAPVKAVPTKRGKF